MRVLLQRTDGARVEVDGKVVGSIGRGLVLLVGIGAGDEPGILDPMAAKIANLRIFADAEGKMNLSLLEIGGDILAVSQFTLYADCKKGRRPSFIASAPPDVGRQLFDGFVSALRAIVPKVETGVFGAMMDVHLVNKGPVTIWLDSAEILGK